MVYVCFIIIFTHRYNYTDKKWQHKILRLWQISTVIYVIGCLFLIGRAIQVSAYFSEIFLIFLNKTIILMLVYNIYYDLNLIKKRYYRLLLYGEILEFYSFCHGFFLTVLFLYFINSDTYIQWIVFIPMCCFWSIFCVSFQYSFFGQKACKKCCDMEQIGKGKCCPYTAKNVSVHLVSCSVVLLIYSSLIFNYNICLSLNNSYESVFGIRGYAFLNFYYCLLMALEFEFGGLPNNKQASLEEIKQNKQDNKQTNDKGDTTIVPTEQLL